jgi:hypothetical protein
MFNRLFKGVNGLIRGSLRYVTEPLQLHSYSVLQVQVQVAKIIH